MKSDDRPPESGNPNRRSTLKTLLLGGGTLTLGSLPAQWIRPVVDSVMLPSHAQTSPPARNGYNVVVEVRAPRSLIDHLIPRAYASLPVFPGPGLLCITGDSSGLAVSYDTGSFTLVGSGNIGGCITLECETVSQALKVNVISANPDGTYDFELHDNSELGCGTPTRVLSATTDIACSLVECAKLGGP